MKFLLRGTQVTVGIVCYKISKDYNNRKGKLMKRRTWNNRISNGEAHGLGKNKMQKLNIGKEVLIYLNSEGLRPPLLA